MLETIKHIILHPLLDALKLMPLLLVVYILIELFEHKASAKIKMGKVLSGKFAPLIGSAVGTIPQCGFGVIASQFYASKIILPGTLIAIFISTSDEALPLLLAEPSAYGKILPLIGIKFLYAAAAGFLINFVYNRIKKKKIKAGQAFQRQVKTVSEKNIYRGSSESALNAAGVSSSGQRNSFSGDDNLPDNAAGLNLGAASITAAHNSAAIIDEKAGAGQNKKDTSRNPEGHDLQSKHQETQADSSGRIYCSCGHDHGADHGEEKTAGGESSKGFKQKAKRLMRFLRHPVKHALTTFLFVFAVGLALEVIITLIGGEEVLSAFMDKMLFLQPVLAALIGLIPSCASSVAITELYITGTLSLGAALSGLSVNAGVALAVLFKDNKKFTENITITVLLYGLGLALGYAVTLVQFFAGA